MKFFLDTVGSALAAFFVVAVLAGWWIYTGPRPVSFLNPHLEEALGHGEGAYRVELGETVLAWAGWKRALDIRLRNAKAVGRDGAVLAEIPELSVGLSFLGLLQGKVALTELEVFNPALVARIGRDGAFGLGLDHDSGGGRDWGGKTGLLDHWLENFAGGPGSEGAHPYLSRFAIYGADVMLKDERYDVIWRAGQADIALSRQDGILSGDASFYLEVDAQNTATAAPAGRIGAFLRYDAGKGQLDLDGHVTDLRLNVLSHGSPDLAFLEKIDLLLSGDASFSIASSGDLRRAAFNFHAGAGRLDIGLGREAVSVDRLSVEGRIAPDGQQLLIDHLAVDIGPTQVSASAVAGWIGEDIALRGEVAVRDLSVVDLIRYWPHREDDFARAWVAENITEGRIIEANAVLSFLFPTGDKQPPEVKMFHGTLEFEDTDVIYLDTMPSVEGIRGAGFFASDRVELIIKGGRVGEMAVDRGIVHLTELDTDIEKAYIEAVTHSPVNELLRILDHDPVRASAFLGINGNRTRGQAEARGTFAFPMRRDLGIDQVDLAAALNLKDVFLPDLVAGWPLEDGALLVRVDKEKLITEGSARLAGIDVRLSGIEHFTDSMPFRSRHNVTAIVDDGMWDRFGLTVDPVLSGPVGVDLIWTDFDRKKANLAVAANLEQVSLRLPVLNWRKESGAPGSAQLNFSLRENSLRSLDEFSVNVAGLHATGRGEFFADGGGLQRLIVSSLQAGRNDLKADIILNPDTAPLIRLTGDSLDLAHFFVKGDEGSGPEDNIPDLSVSTRLDALWVGENAEVSDVSGSLEYHGGLLRSAYLTGYTGPGSRVRYRISPDPEAPTRNVNLIADDAGHFLRAFNLYPYMAGGVFQLSGRIDDSQISHTLTGEIEITDFEIRQSPVFARLLTLASLEGIVERLSGDGLGFQKFTAPFQFRNRSVKFNQGRSFGAIGLTFSGIFDLEQDTVDITGTIVPSYTLNSIWGNIPIIGEILTGGEEGGGIFAATYRVAGDFDSPRVTINPLAALTPGIFREFFGVFEGEKPDSSFVSGSGESEAAKPPPQAGDSGFQPPSLETPPAEAN